MNNKTTKRVKLSLHEASEWAAEGYEIECYALVHPINHTKQVPKISRKTPMRPNDILMLSVEGTPPTSGDAFAAWGHLKKKAFKNATARLTVSQAREALAELGLPSNIVVSRLSYLVHHCKVLRIEAKEE